MGSRIDWLTEFAQPIAKELKPRCGTFKQMLSAGIMVLNDLSAEERDNYMDKASGKDVQLKKINIKPLPIQPEEKAILWSDEQIENFLRTLLENRPEILKEIIGEIIQQALIADRKSLAKFHRSSAQVRRARQKRKKDKPS